MRADIADLADIGDRVQGGPDRFDIGGGIEGPHAIGRERHAGTEVVERPAIDEYAGVDEFGSIDARHDPHDRVLERVAGAYGGRAHTGFFSQLGRFAPRTGAWRGNDPYSVTVDRNAATHTSWACTRASSAVM